MSYLKTEENILYLLFINFDMIFFFLLNSNPIF